MVRSHGRTQRPYGKKDIHKSLKGTDYVYDHCAISDVDEMGRLYFGKYGFFDRRSPAQKRKVHEIFTAKQ